jgi:hypothetical protein
MTRRGTLFESLLVATAGCGPRDFPRVALSGHVTYKGAPLSKASISFIPDIDKEGLGASGIISGGRYSIPAESGPIAGQLHVVIQDARTEGERKAPNAAPPSFPARYAEMNELHVTIPPGTKAYSFDFKLTDEGDAPRPGSEKLQPVLKNSKAVD